MTRIGRFDRDDADERKARRTLVKPDEAKPETRRRGKGRWKTRKQSRWS